MPWHYSWGWFCWIRWAQKWSKSYCFFLFPWALRNGTCFGTCWDYLTSVDSFRLSDICMHNQTRPSLVQIMACCLFGTKPSNKPMILSTFVNWTLGNIVQWDLNQNATIFFEENKFKNIMSKMVTIWSWLQCVNYMLNFSRSDAHVTFYSLQNRFLLLKHLPHTYTHFYHEIDLRDLYI